MIPPATGNRQAVQLKRIISGGQTGADQGALSACLQLGFPCGGWVPKGRRTEKGRVPARYRMRQHWSRHYPRRTERNVRDSDCTIIFTYGKPDGGSLLTIDFAKKHRKPCLKVDLNRAQEQVVARIVRWLKRRCPENGVLNVAGARRSKAPGIHMAVKRAIRDVLLRIAAASGGANRRKTKGERPRGRSPLIYRSAGPRSGGRSAR